MACIKVSSKGEDGTFRIIAGSDFTLNFIRFFYFTDIIQVLIQDKIFPDDKTMTLEDLNPLDLSGLQVLQGIVNIKARGKGDEHCYLLGPTLNQNQIGEPVDFVPTNNMIIAITCLPVEVPTTIFRLQQI